MAEHHDNSKPGTGGSFSISRSGTVSYFPIQKSDGLKPYLAVQLTERLDGTLSASIDLRWMGAIGEVDE
jgi:hypothetical protein